MLGGLSGEGTLDDISLSPDQKFSEIRSIDPVLQDAFANRGVQFRAQVQVPSDELIRPINPKNGYQVTMDKFFEMFNGHCA